MCVTDPADLSFDVDWTQSAEAAGAGVNAKVAGQMLSVGC